MIPDINVTSIQTMELGETLVPFDAD